VKKLYHNSQWLTDHYCDKKWSQLQIAKYCDVTQSTISKWLIKLNIETRSFSEGKCNSKNGSWVDSPYKEYTTLYKLYVEEKRSIPEIAELSKHSNSTISRWLRNTGIKIRNGANKITKPRTGEDNPNWKGGIDIICPTCGRTKSRTSEQCFSCYHDFRRKKCEERLENNQLSVPISKNLRLLIKPWKLQVLERDNYQCVSCGNANKLYAHHIVPFSIIRDQLIMEYGQFIDYNFSTSSNRQKFLDMVKDDKRLWDIENGITLCNDCHNGEHARLKSMIDDALYTYHATVLDNYDGDTISVAIDIGFGLEYETKIRLFGVDTPELKSSDIHKRGKAIVAKAAIKSLCEPGRHIVLRTYKSGKYGRWLGLLMLDHAILNDFLIDTNLAEPYIL
jgi:micrococcal nuclease